MIRFEGYERRIGKIQPVLDKYGFADFEAVRDFTLSKGVDVDKICLLYTSPSPRD